MDRKEQTYRKLEISALWVPIIFSVIIGIFSGFLGFKLMEQKLNAMEPRVCVLEAQYQAIPLMSYKIDLLLSHFKIEIKKKENQ